MRRFAIGLVALLMLTGAFLGAAVPSHPASVGPQSNPQRPETTPNSEPLAPAGQAPPLEPLETDAPPLPEPSPVEPRVAAAGPAPPTTPIQAQAPVGKEAGEPAPPDGPEGAEASAPSLPEYQEGPADGRLVVISNATNITLALGTFSTTLRYFPDPKTN
ncbi:MAG: hypothetical protein QXD84_09150, partial [Thermoplasmata archaeon]